MPSSAPAAGRSARWQGCTGWSTRTQWAARKQICALVGEIRLLPQEGHLVAYLSGDLFGLLALTAEKSDLLLWREPEEQLVAGFGRLVDDDLTSFDVMRGRDQPAPDSKTPPSGWGGGVVGLRSGTPILVAGARDHREPRLPVLRI